MKTLRTMSDNLKFLSIDMINAAASGHPGVAMGLSDILAALATRINLVPNDPTFINRDRLIFSGGHASSLLYSFLHLAGFDLSLDELKRFRQLNSLTAGHPEIKTCGVEIDTGPLGQGIANAVGFALAKKYLNHKLNGKLNYKIICLCGDGDLEEGISYEACSFAQSHELNDLILIYDRNQISIEGDVKQTFCEDINKRFEALGFFVQEIDGHDFEQILKAFDKAKNADAPSIIIANTKIAKGALELEGTAASHGSPLGSELAKRAKEAAGYNTQEFYISSEAKEGFAQLQARANELVKAWENQEFSSEEKEFLQGLKASFEVDFSQIDLSKDQASRQSNELCLQAIAKSSQKFIGGSADLAPSNKSYLKDCGDIKNGGQNISFGIREHAMGAICNALARENLTPFCATFMVFSDYLKPAIRLAALMKLQLFYVFTHDSIGVGEDGPTHQPIEQLSALRTLCDTLTFRPADTAENIACWQIALKTHLPSAFVLSRSKLKALNSSIPDISKGAYFIQQNEAADFTLIASGSEVALAQNVAKILEEKGKNVQVLSMPCFELFDELFDKSQLKGKIIAIEAAKSLEMYKYCDEVINMQSFGASGKESEVFEHFGFNASKIAAKIL